MNRREIRGPEVWEDHTYLGYVDRDGYWRPDSLGSPETELPDEGAIERLAVESLSDPETAGDWPVSPWWWVFLRRTGALRRNPQITAFWAARDPNARQEIDDEEVITEATAGEEAAVTEGLPRLLWPGAVYRAWRDMHLGTGTPYWVSGGLRRIPPGHLGEVIYGSSTQVGRVRVTPLESTCDVVDLSVLRVEARGGETWAAFRGDEWLGDFEAAGDAGDAIEVAEERWGVRP